MNKIKVTLLGDKEPLLIAIKFLKKKIHIANIICSNNNVVENYCKKNNINFLNIKKFQKMETTNKFLLYNSDFAISFSYPLRLSLNTIRYFNNRIYNFHPADLPKYRGNLPTVWPILNGDKHAYYTLHKVTKNFDQGPIIDKIRIKIYHNDTGISLYKKLLEKLPTILSKNLQSLILNKMSYKKQNEKKAKFYSKNLPNKGFVSHHWKGKYIENYVRALFSDIHTPAQAIVDKKIIKLYKVKYLKNRITKTSSKNIMFKCNDGYIKVIKYDKKK